MNNNEPNRLLAYHTTHGFGGASGLLIISSAERDPMKLEHSWCFTLPAPLNKRMRAEWLSPSSAFLAANSFTIPETQLSEEAYQGIQNIVKNTISKEILSSKDDPLRDYLMVKGTFDFVLAENPIAKIFSYLLRSESDCVNYIQEFAQNLRDTDHEVTIRNLIRIRNSFLAN